MMSRRFPLCQSACSGVAIALALVTSVAMNPATGQDRLSAGVMATSRGNNINNVLTNPLCDALQGNAGCVAIFASCKTCRLTSYATTLAGANGGYNTGVAGGGICGNNFAGSCNNALVCVKATNLNVACAKPVAPPSLQP